MKCRTCKKEFEPHYTNGILTSKICVSCLLQKMRSRKKKAWRIEKKEIKEKLKTKGDHLKDLQRVFNTFIRLRDKYQPCISCGCRLSGKYDAGHYFSVGAYPNLRFNENNTHGQCVHCNRHKHGNISEYAIRMPFRIGVAEFEKLKSEREKPLHLSIPEIKELIKIYKNKINEYK